MKNRPGAHRARSRAGAGAVCALVVLACGCGTGQSDAAVPAPRTPTVRADRVDDESPGGETPHTTTVSTNGAGTKIADPSTSADATIPATPSTTADTVMTAPTSTATTVGTTSLPPTAEAPVDVADYPATTAAFERLAGANAAASISVVRNGDPVVRRASGRTIAGAEATSDSPMVVASVSKIVVALGIARLAERGVLDVSAPYPWSDVGLEPGDPLSDVTVRELLDHQGGVPKVQEAWFTGDGTCADFVPSLLTAAPTADRGRWVYSNGNYCLLGLLIEQRTGKALDVALQELVFDPVDADGVHLTTDGLRPTDVAHVEGVERLSRLGGAGALVVSTDDLAMAAARMTAADRSLLRPPGVFTDQYGFGHTGTITGAKSCVWVLELGATVVAATISGNSVGSGGDVCDLVVPAVAADLGLGSAKPDRTP